MIHKYTYNMILVLCNLYYFLIINLLYRHCSYKVQWHLVPLHIQKLILFLIQRSNKVFGLNVGGLFVASLECFAAVRNMFFIW